MEQWIINVVCNCASVCVWIALKKLELCNLLSQFCLFFFFFKEMGNSPAFMPGGIGVCAPEIISHDTNFIPVVKRFGSGFSLSSFLNRVALKPPDDGNGARGRSLAIS